MTAGREWDGGTYRLMQNRELGERRGNWGGAQGEAGRWPEGEDVEGVPRGWIGTVGGGAGGDARGDGAGGGVGDKEIKIRG